MEFYGATYFPFSKILISRFWKIDQKIRGRAEFYGISYNSARSSVFQSVFKDFVKCKKVVKTSHNIFNFIFIKFYGFWKISPKTRVRAEFLGPRITMGCPMFFGQLSKILENKKIYCPSQKL